MRLRNSTCHNQVLRNYTEEEEDKELGGAIEVGEEKKRRESKVKISYKYNFLYESKFIEKIVKVVEDKLSRTPLSVEPKLIGVESQVNDINLWLQDGSTDVGILVVYGMSGIGKTTIAKHVYNSNFRSFEGSSFIENIRETADRPNGLVQIQKQLLSDILNDIEVKIHGVSEGLRKIERAISSRRVLLVLDDVDHMDQLDAVLKMKDRFYPGSKILITTRRERLLKAHQVTKVHKVGTLYYDESLELFSSHAFGQDHPLRGYMEYSEKVVHYCKGLPLALKVLGSSLSGESIDVWESALEKLKLSLMGTQTIQGLPLDMRMHLANIPINTNETVLETNAFEMMCNLQLLHLSCVRLDGCYADFPTRLRWLCWLEFPLDSIPVDLHLDCLIVLEMQHSSLRQVWKGTKFLPLLKILDVSHSHALTEIMDFSLCPSLEELILVDCTNLIDVHESIGNLERLVYLNTKDCKNLRMLPKNMCMLKSLETLIIWNEVPGRFSYKSTKSSISFSVPLLPSSHRIRGLNIFATYANEENSNNGDDGFRVSKIIKVSNKSKGLKWIYWPLFYGIPCDEEDMIWLSHWRMENETILQCGDQVVVSVMARPDNLFQIKEFGVELMQEHQNNMMISTQHNTKSDPNYPHVIGGDLSMWEHIPGIYCLGFNGKIVEDTDHYMHRWFNRLIMDTDEGDTDKEGQEDEPDYTIARPRAASNNCSLRGWKVLVTAAGLFFTLALVVRSSISQKKKRQ
ncbi:unnamed protein product [Malus baccata var. baccata]